ncbi:HEPN-associated N-terminal domain-containing protein [Mycolicibacterium fortuitum]|uniref:HEPN-associated N-terminal domain-containing protein n=1 Tax=Mycolicibacterium fortuitum TaxID=1766 RepID=UPI003A86E022
MEIHDQAFTDVHGGGLCREHITDACLSQRLERFVTEYSCAICGRTRPPEINAPFALPLDEVLRAVAETVHHFYSDATEVLPWDNEESRLVGPQLESWEVVQDIAGGAFEPTHEDKIIELIVEAIGDDVVWTSWFTAAATDGHEYAWEQFAQTAMHQTRMVVGLGSPADPPARLTEFLNSVLLYAKSELGLVRQLPVGTEFYRGRLYEDADSLRPHSDDLGPAPSAIATANRLSSAGIGLFYASGDPQTAIAEIAGHGVKPLAVIGKFTNTRELRILDLTGVPTPISPFCMEEREHARMGRFLTSFVHFITAPVIPDDRVHVEYAPTQLLTEYLRWVSEPKLEGIALPSAQTHRCTYVLFFGRSDCTTSGDPARENDFGIPPPEPVLTLDPGTVTAYKVERQYSGVDARPFHHFGSPSERR